MSSFRALDRKLRSEDVSQFLSLFLLFIVLGVMFSWSGSALTPNESWYTVTAICRTGLGLLALYLAARSLNQDAVERFPSFLLLAVTSFMTIPFRLITFAASQPAASLGMNLAFDLVFPLALFGICLLLAAFLIRVAWLSLPLTLVLVAAGAALDEVIGYRLFSPVAIITVENWALVATWGAVALASGVWLGLKVRRQQKL